MWEVWLYKTIIAFLSIQVLQIVFHKYIKIAIKKSDNSEGGVSKLRGFINSILVSMIPCLRWIFVSLIVMVIIAGVHFSVEDNK